MQWLFERRLAVKATRVRSAVQAVEAIVGDGGPHALDIRRRRAQRIFGKMHFPLEQVTRLIMQTANGA
jgi:hypothetical protein